VTIVYNNMISNNCSGNLRTTIWCGGLLIPAQASARRKQNVDGKPLSIQINLYRHLRHRCGLFKQARLKRWQVLWYEQKCRHFDLWRGTEKLQKHTASNRKARLDHQRWNGLKRLMFNYFIVHHE
jgi:hypothetical protein